MQPKESKTNKHFWLSMIKSVFRILAAISLMSQNFQTSGFLFALAEGLGIAEEL